MTPFTNPRIRTIENVQWLHRLFVRGGLALSCDVNARGDGTYVATLFPLWAVDAHVADVFMSSADATRWHAQITQQLQEAGWLLVEGRAVTSAA